MRFWLTTEVITHGIVAVDCREPDVISPEVLYLQGGYFVYGEGLKWHRTRAGAVARAKEIKMAELKSLAEAMLKIAALDFDEA